MRLLALLHLISLILGQCCTQHAECSPQICNYQLTSKQCPSGQCTTTTPSTVNTTTPATCASLFACPINQGQVCSNDQCLGLGEAVKAFFTPWVNTHLIVRLSWRSFLDFVYCLEVAFFYVVACGVVVVPGGEPQRALL
jgi:hypothetical protein